MMGFSSFRFKVGSGSEFFFPAGSGSVEKNVGSSSLNKFPRARVKSYLLHALEVVLCDAGLTNGPGAEVHDVVAVVLDLGEQLGHPALSPITP